LNTTHQPAALPQRIVSLVPSQTELLYELGLEEQVCGITRFCINPSHWRKTKKNVGGTKKINMDAVRKLQPDLILANREENIKEQVEMLAADYPVWVTDVHDLGSALSMIGDVGNLTGKPDKAGEIRKKIEAAFCSLTFSDVGYRTAYLIWKDPYMSVGHDTFIDDMLRRIGLKNIFAERTRYPEVTIGQIRERGCQLLLLSSEPYPFKASHVSELQQALPETSVQLVDGEMFSWYGSRLLKSAGYFRELIREIA
jgi:ABC-type Fe3+-hydroxamate transport system substrate-binding protein